MKDRGWKNPNPPKFIQHLIAPNDANGNPRRVFLVLDAFGVPTHVIDEGLRGRGALVLVPELKIYTELPEIETTPAFRRSLLRGEAPWKVVHS